MLLPVSSVNASIVPTPGAVTVTSAEATWSTLMNVLTSKALPPQVPATVGCLRTNSIDGTFAAVGVRTPCGVKAWLVPADAAKPAVAHDSAAIPDQALSAATTVRKI